MRRLLALALAVALPLPALAGEAPRLRAWPAISGSTTAEVAARAESLRPDALGADDPFCAPQDQLAATLAQEFGEALVDDSRVASRDTQLWASDLRGTWTLVLARADAVHCVIASGTGWAAGTAADAIYSSAGLA